MTQHDLTARAHHWAIAAICGVAFGAVAAHLDKERDAEQDRAPVEQQAKAGERQ